VELFLFLTRFSGCWAVLSQTFIIDDTNDTVGFFNDQVNDYQHNDLALSILQTLLESLTTYHIPAEIALGSFDEPSQRYIEDRYSPVINRIKTQRREIAMDRAQYDSEAEGYDLFAISDIIDAEKKSVPELIAVIIPWTRPSQIHIPDNLRDNEKYIYLKIFVLLTHLLTIATTPENKADLIQLSAKSISKFDIDRIVICEGIILSVFLKIPFRDKNGEWEMGKIRNGLKINTMWNDILRSVERNTAIRIRTFLNDAVVFEDGSTVTTPSAELSPTGHVHNKLITQIIELASAAKDYGMESAECRTLLLWARRVWDRFPHVGQGSKKGGQGSKRDPKVSEKATLEKEFVPKMFQLVTSFNAAGAGTTGLNSVGVQPPSR
jgi:hypothetical protein